MDIEKTIEFILDMQANAEVEMQKIREAQAQTEAEMKAEMKAHAAHAAQHDLAMDRIDKRLDRAIRLGIRAAREERKQRQQANTEFDQKITQLAAAQLETEESLKGFIESMRRGGNGSH